MNIALPESLEPLVRKRVEERGYASAEEYVRDLILSDEEWRAPDGHILTGAERQDIEMIDLRLLKSIASGPSIMADEAYWEAKKQRLRARRTNGS